MRFPGAEADPAEVGAAALVLAHHVVTAAVLLNRHAALGTLLPAGRRTGRGQVHPAAVPARGPTSPPPTVALG